jgi:peptidoglycan/LPS O-acetylase OafA/YrhL
MFNPGAIRYYLRLLALSLVFVILVITVGRLSPSLFDTTDALFLTAGFALAAFSSLLIFFNGFFSDKEKSVFLTLIALGVKMLLSFVLALLYLLVFKNDAIGAIFLFFILYLAFTVFVVLTFTGVLKKKSD